MTTWGIKLRCVSDVDCRLSLCLSSTSGLEHKDEISLLKQKVDKINEQLDQHPVNFNEIVKQQVSESLEAVNDNIQVVQTTIQETRAQAAEDRKSVV